MNKWCWYQSIYVSEHFMYKGIEYVKIDKYACKRVNGTGDAEGYVLHYNTPVLPIKAA